MSPLVKLGTALLACLIVGKTRVRAEPATAPATRPAFDVLTPAELSVQKDLRIVRDVARLDLGLVAGERGLPWVLARLSDVQGRQEQVGRLMGADGVGRFAPNTAATRFYLEGRIETLEVLTIPPEHPLIGYREPMMQSHEVFDGEHRGGRYSPFLSADGGLVICRVNDLYPELSRFLPAYMIPSGWRKFVIPAYDHRLDNGPLLKPADAPKNRAELVKLLDDENPLIAAAACRTLTIGGAMDAPTVHRMMQTTDRLRQAVFTCIVLAEGAEGAKADRIADLVGEVDAAAPADGFPRVRGIALGTLAAVIEIPWGRDWPAVLPLVDRLAANFSASAAIDDADRHTVTSLNASTKRWRARH
jgi:hypothetical protein